MLVQMVKVYPSFLRFFYDKLCRITHHEILLVYPQELSCLVAVVRVEEQCKVLFNIIFVELYSIVNNRLIHTVQIKQMQLIASTVVSWNVNVIHCGFQCKIFEWHFKTHICPFQPALVCNPRIFFLLLLIIPEFLHKETIMVIQAHTISIKSQCSNRIQKARS